MSDVAYITNAAATLIFTEGSKTVTVTGTNPILEGVLRGDRALDPNGMELAIDVVAAGTLTLLRNAPTSGTVQFDIAPVSRLRTSLAANAEVTREVYAKLRAAAEDNRSIPVISQATAPPGSPADGDRHLVIATATGAFAGKEGYIAQHDAANARWLFIAPIAGWTITVDGVSTVLVYTGADWTGVGAGDVVGPASSTDSDFAQFDGLTGRLLKGGKAAPTGDIVGTTDTQTLTGKLIDWRAAVDVASATTTDIGAAASNLVRITGTTTITGLGTAGAGVARWLRFAGALTLTHNATSLILPYGASITTEAGATALFVSEGSGNWRCHWYQPATSSAARTILGALAKAGDTVLGALELAATVDVASAATANIGAAASNVVRITGTTTITSFGTAAANVWRLVRFAGALTLTHNAASLILPYGGNITTAAGDTALFVSEGSGNWRCYFYTKLSAGGTTNFKRADGTWAAPAGGGGGRELLTANRTYYVRTDGSDSNDGLANTSGGAFLTIQKAVDVACSLDLGIYAVTINVADGTYTGAVTLKKYVGAGPISIIGNATTPGNVAISVTSNNCFAANQTPAYTLSGMKLSAATSGSGVRAQNGSPITLTHIHFGACATTHIWSESNATVSITTAYTIDGGAGRHWLAYRGGLIFGPGAVTITLSGTPNFSTAFADAQLTGGMEVNGITFSGSATGVRYSVTMNGFINTIGGGASYLPGNSAGSAATGGQYA